MKSLLAITYLFTFFTTHGSSIPLKATDFFNAPSTGPRELHYSDGVYNDLAKYAYISKATYCLEGLIPEGFDLSTPLSLNPLQHRFIQKGDMHTIGDHSHTNGGDIDGFPVELYVAKALHSHTHSEDITDTQSEFFASEGLFAVDHSGSGSVILSLRGDFSSKDIITDVGINTIDYIPLHPDARSIYEEVACQDCKVHKGFHKRLEEIKDEVFPTLQQLMDVFSDYQLVIVGHSLGGSLASLIGLEFALMDYKPLVVSFGSPKVSNKELSEFMDLVFGTTEFSDDIVNGKNLTDGLLRVVHKGDYVPLLPPSTSFYPAGVEFEIDKEDLPHTKESVRFTGLSSENEHSVPFKPMDILSFSFKKILHLKEHSEYFWPISSCDDIHT